MNINTSFTDSSERRQVVVVGGGVIGLSAGYHLSRDGYEVTVLDSGEFGAGASWGNAGWIVPSLVHPFNVPNALPQALLSMLKPHSAIALRRLPSTDLVKFAWRFARASSPKNSEAALKELARFAATATTDMQQLAADIDFECHRDGLLVPFRSEAALESYAAGHRHIEELGYTGRVERLDKRQVHAREPSLGEDVVGGLHFLDEMSVRPSSLTAALAKAIIASGNEAAKFERVRTIKPMGKQWRVETTRRVLLADAVVVAAGERSAELVRPLGVSIPLTSGRGCSILLQPEQLQLRQPLKIAEFRVACTPFENGEVRVSGTFDFTELGAGPEVGRLRSILRAASTHLPCLAEVDISPSDVWAGARPCTPDSVPLVKEATGTPGLFLATGHGTLGVTLSPETGRRIAALVARSFTPQKQGVTQ